MKRTLLLLCLVTMPVFAQAVPNPGTAQNEWQASGDFLRLYSVGLNGRQFVGGIDSTGKGYGSMTSGLAFVASLPATCTPGITASVQLSVAPYTINYCSATNTWTATGTGSVPSVFGRTGAVVATLGDYSCALVTGCVANPVTTFNSRTGAVVPTTGDYTLDQIGNPAGTVTFSIGATAPVTFTDPGTFTSAAESDDFQSVVLGGNNAATVCNPLRILNQGGTTFKFTNAVAGTVCVPPGSSGVTNAYSNGVLGQAWVPNSGTGGQFGWVGGVGVDGQGVCAANNAHCWGMNAGAADLASQTGNSVIGNELDVQVNNNSTVGYAALASFRGNGQPTSDNFPAFGIVAPSGTGSFTSGFQCQTASITGANTPCVNIYEQTAGNSKASMTVNFHSTNSSGTDVPYKLFSTVDGLGNPQLTTASYNSSFVSGQINMKQVTVASLPSAANSGAGTMMIVTDATTFTPGTCTGGGSDYMIAVSNGTTWSCH